MKKICLAFFLLPAMISLAQSGLGKLTVEKIMRDPKWIGSSPSNPQWSADGKSVFFNWNPDRELSDSMYFASWQNTTPIKATINQKQDLVSAGALQYNKARNACVYARDGDLFYMEKTKGITRRFTETAETESNPVFSFNDTRIVYTRGQNLYAWDISTGNTQQLTNLKTATGSGSGSDRSATGNSSRSSSQGDDKQGDWLKKDQLQYFQVLRTRKEKKEKADAYNKAAKLKELRTINIDDKILQGLTISPDGRFISYRLIKSPSKSKTTIVPSFVTETGFTTDLPARTKVGAPEPVSEFFLYDRERDTVWAVKTDSIPGIRDLPDYLKDYPQHLEEAKKKNAARPVTISGPYWSPGGKHALLDIRSQDNKDRWLMLWDTATQKLGLVDRQRDEAWIGGPGIFGSIGWIDETNCWFQSEASGYSHLYAFNTSKAEKKPLTTGKYEVLRAQLSRDKKYFFITTNEVHPGEQHFYRLEIATGKKHQITSQTGSNQVSMSPDEKYIAILHSYANKPWELYLQENKPGGKLMQVTTKAQSDEFKTYAWRDPELISFKARDGAEVYARLYQPANPHPSRPAVIFVHGAGYLQNAHKWWSNYFREYMFHNMLADNGYFVLDIDYRGSAGYGRDWRTGIYRHMGGKDLSDHVDGAEYLVKKFGVDPKRIGIYGGSYGGFITLMAMFNEPDAFAAGAALRPVTDWANYNHPYTSNILNEPFNDSIAYRKSSPIYFAEGLRGDLLICHGMIDVNVHYQDAVKLAQRLIELGKDDWELASYPMEDHGFVEPSSWTDEYKRIFKLFERTLK